MSRILRLVAFVAAEPVVCYAGLERPIGHKTFSADLLRERRLCFGGLSCMGILVNYFSIHCYCYYYYYYYYYYYFNVYKC